MVIFISGVHGVGKSFLSSHFASQNGWFYTSASDLIKKGKSSNWGDNKKVKDISSNQDILISEFKKTKKAHDNIIIDGHAALINKNGEIELIDSSIFRELSIDGIILLEEKEEVIKERFKSRSLVEIDYNLSKLIKLEREHIRAISKRDEIPLIELKSANISDFENSIEKLKIFKR